MSFRDPRWLWLLTLLPVIWLLARRGVASGEREVSSLFLWKKALASLPAAASSSRQRMPPSLWLWLLSFAFLSLALASPEREVVRAPRVLVLAEDGARMQARSADGRTRWEKLVQSVERLLGTIPGTLVRLETVPGGVLREGSASEIAAHLRTLAPVARSARFDREIAMRRSAFASFDVVLLASDREPVWGEQGLPTNASLLLVGESSKNVGWVSAFRSEDGFSALAKNFSNLSQSRTVRLETAGRTLEERSLVLDPSETRALRFPRGSIDDPATRLRLEPSDELTLDDVLEPQALSQEIRVRIPADLPRSLHKAFAAIPGVRVLESHGGIAQEGDADFFLRDAPQPCAKPVLRLRRGSEAFAPHSLRAHSEDALGKLLGFEGMKIDSVFRVVPESAAGTEPQRLASAVDESGREWPLLWREGKDLAMAFDLERSDWPLHPSFPVFWAAWVEEIRGRYGAGENTSMPDPSDTNGVMRQVDRISLSGAVGVRREPFSDALLLAAALAFLLAAVLEWKHR